MLDQMQTLREDTLRTVLSTTHSEHPPAYAISPIGVR